MQDLLGLAPPLPAALDWCTITLSRFMLSWFPESTFQGGLDMPLVALILGFLSALAGPALPAPVIPAAPVALQGTTRMTTGPGACCVMFAPCQFLTETECTQLYGQFMGEGTDCGFPMICPTWGA
jgi:hypothetical protein